MSIIISKLNKVDNDLLESFKIKEWPEADRENYNNQELVFSRDFYTLVAKDKDKIIAYIKFYIELGVVYIDSLIVRKNHRRKGVATKLIYETEFLAKSLGAHKIHLETGLDWQARSLYEKNGYKVRAILPNYYANQDFILFDKDI